MISAAMGTTWTSAVTVTDAWPFRSSRTQVHIAAQRHGCPARPSQATYQRAKGDVLLAGEPTDFGGLELDWHILLAVHGVATNARLRYRSTCSPDDLEAVRELFLAPEPDDDPVPPGFFLVSALEPALEVTLPASASNMWKLALRQQSIDIDAVKRLLISRYGWARDDVEHEDPFQS